MSLQPGATPTAYRPLAILLSCVLVLAVALTWAYLAMRAVMDVGGSCAEGGPYEIAQPCPDGAWMISVAIPVLIVAAMLGSYVALRLSAPNLLVPMWTVLFAALGWNFLAYGFGDDGPVWGWVVCGVMFELMALPGLVLIVAGSRLSAVRRFTPDRQSPPGPGQAPWWAAYAVLGLAGAALGWWSFDAMT